MPRRKTEAKSEAPPTRVAIIGGGIAALTTAFELTRPEHGGRHDVTVYQMGWRLGGKGASSRGVADRIEEHGLHLWMGFYENAFRLMRECYAELPPMRGKRRFATWQDAFQPAHDVGLCDRGPSGDWEFWIAHFPSGKGLPGDPLEEGSPFTVARYLQQSASLLGELIRSAHAIQAERASAAAPAPAPTGRGRRKRSAKAESRAEDSSAPGADAAKAAFDRLVRYGQLAGTAAIFEAVDFLRQALDTWMPAALRESTGVLVRLIEALAATARLSLKQLVRGDAELRRIWQVIDLILATLRGATIYGLAFDPRGFDAINELDSREWLRMNGASEESLDSDFMRGVYDLAFAFEGGDVERPRLAAGVGLRGTMRMFFTYRGSLFWRMSAGMGEIVFSPLYEVLRQRGVRFEFFHRLADVGLSEAVPGETPHVTSLAFDVQAAVKEGRAYEPLVVIRGVPCWPAGPDYAQLEDGERMAWEGRDFEGHWETRNAGRRTLRVGKDFDLVVLGVSVGAIPHVARELVAREPKWRDMVQHVKSVPTQAFQLWMREDMETLGWKHPQVNLSGFVEPCSTWADMRHVIAHEGWKGRVKAVAYFCGVLPDAAPEGGDITKAHFEAQRALVRDTAVDFLNTHVGALWPDAVARGRFRWELLTAEEDATTSPAKGARRFDTQFWTANVNPSDRYVLALPGSVRYRLSPLDMSFDNLTIAGDWTQTGLDSGCIESATMSGKLAAHALSQHPPLHDIVGYDHP